MKSLKGMGNFASLENKKINNMEKISIVGGSSFANKSNVDRGDGCSETDYYSDAGGQVSYISRGWLCIG